MEMKIAALTYEGELASIEDCTEVLLFEKEYSAWRVFLKHPFNLSGRSSSEIRDSVRSLILQLECTVVVARHISGIPYRIFDTMGFSIFEADTLSCELLDDLIQDIKKSQIELRKEQTSTEPIPIDEEGRWFFDLISLQENHPEISSKQALRPFIQNKAFLELKLLCTHLPPWLDIELPANQLGYKIEARQDGRLMVNISRTLCKE
jgi:Fe-only nitrogenase accessory protein AnfO